MILEKASSLTFLHFRYSGRAKDALTSFNIARRDSDWGERAVENMIKICLNPDQDTLGGEVLENLEDM